MRRVWSLLGILSGMVIALRTHQRAARARPRLAHRRRGGVVRRWDPECSRVITLATVQARHLQSRGGLLRHGCSSPAAAWRDLRDVRAGPHPQARRGVDHGVYRERAIAASGSMLDRLGYFDLASRELTLGRVAGAVLLVIGALMIRVY